VHHDLATVRASFDWALLLNVRGVAAGPVAEALSEENVRRAYGAPSGGDPEREPWAA
jgi:manganese/zinc/iron transport system ATP- binding protein